MALTMDSAGKFLFVADSAKSGRRAGVGLSACRQQWWQLNRSRTGSPFSLPVETGGSTASASALAVTPTIYPVQYSYCSGHTPPTTENLYVTDASNYVLLNYSVDPSAGTLTLMPYSTSAPGIPTGRYPPAWRSIPATGLFTWRTRVQAAAKTRQRLHDL